MNEIQRILKLKASERTASDIAYLEAHKNELTPEEQAQLDAEKQEADQAAAEAEAQAKKEQEEKEAADAEAAKIAEEEEQKSIVQKKLGTKIHKDFNVELKELSNGHLQAVVNSGLEDRHGEVLDMKGLDIATYMKNPILANGHDYSKPSVGKTYKLTKRKDGSLDAEFEFATDIDGYNEPKILDQLYRKGYQFAFSIGFIPFEAEGNVYTKSEMIEFSPVLIGADARALLKSKELLKQKGIDIDFSVDHNEPMNKFKELLKKAIEDLTVKDIAFLKENQADMDEETKSHFASVLENKSENALAKSVEALAASVEAVAKDVTAIKSQDKVARKNIILTKSGEPLTKDNASKEMKFLLYARGLQTKDFSGYMQVVDKAAYDPMNTTNESTVLPPQEFIAEVQRLEEAVGVAERYATVKRSSTGAGLKYVLGDDDLEIYDTAEGGKKRSTSLTYKEVLLAWRKFAGILPITDELTEDSAIDLWNDATQRFARAFAKRGDQLVFTEVAAGGNTKDGILNVAGTNVVTLDGDSINDLTYDNLVDMIYGVPSQSGNTGSFFLNRSVIAVVMKIKDDENRPVWQPSMTAGAPGTILGRPYVETEVLPNLTDSESDLPFMVYGDLRYVTLGYRTDLNIKIFDAGTVGGVDDADADTHPINLVTQDAQAMRAVRRMNAVVRFPEAFSVATTSTGS